MQAERTTPADYRALFDPPTPTWTISSRQRDPLIFAGLRGDDVEDWLDNYNHVSSFNGWDDPLKRRHASLYLSDAAETWFLHHEEDLKDWSLFPTQPRQTFGTTSTRSEVAKRKLKVRVQHPGETYTSYIEDVLPLCRQVNPV